jgi:hypothetical protein
MPPAQDYAKEATGSSLRRHAGSDALAFLTLGTRPLFDLPKHHCAGVSVGSNRIISINAPADDVLQHRVLHCSTHRLRSTA